MTLLSRVRSFVRAIIFRRRLEREIEADLQFHIAERADDLVSRGLTRTEAERRAREELGEPIRWKEEGREAFGLRMLDDLRGMFALILWDEARRRMFLARCRCGSVFTRRCSPSVSTQVSNACGWPSGISVTTVARFFPLASRTTSASSGMKDLPPREFSGRRPGS